MCFRPPEATAGSKQCPNCMKINPPGVTTCSCGQDLSEVVDVDPMAGVPVAGGRRPVTPRGPKPPARPSAPSVPSAGK